MDELTTLSATKIAALIRARALSPVEALAAYLRRIEELNPSLNAIVSFAPDALERARQSEAAVMRREKIGPLHGVPVTVKDTFDVAGMRSTSGSRLRAERVPQSDATAVERLRAAGALILGKTNVPEMALTYDSENPVFGRTNNPHDLSRTPGGSSGGEAASIAACLSAFGLGSDLVGSIRIPAHFCGVVGLKPTAGTVPGEGHCPQMTGRLVHAASFGPLARRVEDLLLMFDVLAGTHRGHLDKDGLDEGTASLEKEVAELRGQRVAWYAYDGVIPVGEETARAVEAAARALADAGMELVQERPPAIERGAALWLERFWPDVVRAIRKVYVTSTEQELAGPAVRALLSRATHAPVVSEAEQNSVDQECERLRLALIEWMNDRPLVIAPVGAIAAFKHGARKVTVGSEEISVFNAFGYAQSFNTFNLPVACVPAGRTREGLPIGVQIAGRPNQERMVLAAALIVEEALGGWRPPSLALPTAGHNPL